MDDTEWDPCANMIAAIKYAQAHHPLFQPGTREQLRQLAEKAAAWSEAQGYSLEDDDTDA